MSKQGKLPQNYCCFAICLSCLFQMLDRPDNRKENSTTTDNVDKKKQLLPLKPVLCIWPRFADHGRSNIGNNLQGNDNHEHFLVFLLKIRSQKRPSSANQDN
eukprot:Gb_14830 [translate_table: standard]